MMMMNTSPAISYSIWLKRILDAHLTKSWNAPPTERTVQEADELHDLWPEVDDRQKDRLWGLSADLYSLQDREVPVVDVDDEPLTAEELLSKQKEAFARRDWDGLLGLLRRSPETMARDRVAYARGRAWMDLGSPAVALLFFDNATRLAPNRPNYGALAMECLKSLERWPEALERLRLYMGAPTAHPRLLFRAADAMRCCAARTGEMRWCEDAIAAIDEGLRRVPTFGPEEAAPSLLAGAYTTKSLCLDWVGRSEEALKVLEQAVERVPNHALLWTALGWLKKQRGMPGALDDFRRAIALGTTNVWPYVELARHAVEHGIQGAVELCQKGLPFAQHETEAAALHELLGIALVRERQSIEAARAAFTKASELDPMSDEFRANRRAFEKYLDDPSAGEPPWQFPALPIAIDDICSQLACVT